MRHGVCGSRIEASRRAPTAKDRGGGLVTRHRRGPWFRQESGAVRMIWVGVGAGQPASLATRRIAALVSK